MAYKRISVQKALDILVGDKGYNAFVRVHLGERKPVYNTIGHEGGSEFTLHSYDVLKSKWHDEIKKMKAQYANVRFFACDN